MAGVEMPLDTSAAVTAVVETLSGYATTLGNFGKELETMGSTTLAGWYGAAERMTTREITAVGKMLDVLASSLGRATAALKTYAAVLKQAEGELATLATQIKDAPDSRIPAASGDMPTISGMPVLTATATPRLHPTNLEILTRVYNAATTCNAALRGEANKVGMGPASGTGGYLSNFLPFQRNPPLIPGTGPQSKDKVPLDVNSARGGPNTELLQKLLLARGWNIKVTGKYDAQTERVVRQFQINKGLEVGKPGKVDQTTWQAIWNKKIIW